jgi:hypothetical protein
MSDDVKQRDIIGFISDLIAAPGGIKSGKHTN